jgi:hypothetical protein
MHSEPTSDGAAADSASSPRSSPRPQLSAVVVEPSGGRVVSENGLDTLPAVALAEGSPFQGCNRRVRAPTTPLPSGVPEADAADRAEHAPEAAPDAAPPAQRNLAVPWSNRARAPLRRPAYPLSPWRAGLVPCLAVDHFVVGVRPSSDGWASHCGIAGCRPSCRHPCAESAALAAAALAVAASESTAPPSAALAAALPPAALAPAALAPALPITPPPSLLPPLDLYLDLPVYGHGLCHCVRT